MVALILGKSLAHSGQLFFSEGACPAPGPGGSSILCSILPNAKGTSRAGLH